MAAGILMRTPQQGQAKTSNSKARVAEVTYHFGSLRGSGLRGFMTRG
jgi:hypothetical protein